MKVYIPSDAGNIAAIITKPEFESEKLAILCPGFLDTKDYRHLLLLAERLSEEGYTIVRFDPTGTWESSGDISEYTTTQYLEDIKSVLNYMFEQKKYERVLLGGHSRGGQLAILYAARDHRITELLCIMPSHGPIEGEARENWQRNSFKESTRDIPNSKETVQFKVPFSHVLDRDKYDALKDVSSLRIPIILAAGELDDVVPKEDVEELYDSANEPKKFILLEEIDHDYRLNDSEVEFVNSKLLGALN